MGLAPDFAETLAIFTDKYGNMAFGYFAFGDARQENWFMYHVPPKDAPLEKDRGGFSECPLAWQPVPTS